MTPVFHPRLVNPPFADPGVFVDFLYNRRALLFDLGTLDRFPTRKLLRTSHVFISHTHIDHFIGFDHLLRLCLGRDKQLHLFGPPGLIAQVGHRLAAYTWNLVVNYETDFTVIVTEIHPDHRGEQAEFHCCRGFRMEQFASFRFAGQIIHDEEGFSVRAVPLDHQIASLAFALEEKTHVNIMKNRLAELGLATGPWLKELKNAIMRGASDETEIRTQLAGGRAAGSELRSLGELRTRAVKTAPGQKVCYVTDVAYTPENAAKIIDLAQGADYLFIEAVFLEADAQLAAVRHHLTAWQAGSLAHAAGAARVIPFHFSPRYTDREQELRDEVERAWNGA